MIDELSLFLEKKHLNLVSTLKKHNFSINKGNYLVKSSTEKFLLKMFSGFKKKYLRNEHKIRKALVSNNFPNISEGIFDETESFTYLLIPYIENKGNLNNQEQFFGKKIMNLLDAFHSLPIDDFKDFRPYRLFLNNYFSRNNYPNTFKLLSSKDISIIHNYFEKLQKNYDNYPLVVSHNDFDGDNLLLGMNNNLILTDFEKCSLNTPLEDLSRIYFFNAITSKKFFENNNLYVDILGFSKIKQVDFDAFVLYQAIRANEFINTHSEFAEDIYFEADFQETFINLISMYSKNF